jgi:hypothetical protein
VTVPVVVAVGHDHQPIAHRRDRDLAAGPRAIPQLEIAAPGRVPGPRQVVQHRDRAIEVARAVAVEVGVEREVAAGQGRQEAGAGEVRVGDQPAAPGQRSEEVEEDHPAQLGEEPAQRRRDVGEAGALELPQAAGLLDVIAALPVRMVRGREDLRQRPRALVAEEPIEDDVGVRRCGAVGGVVRAPEGGQRGAVEGPRREARQRRGERRHGAVVARHVCAAPQAR